MKLLSPEITQIIYKHFHKQPSYIKKINQGVMAHKYLFEVDGTMYVLRIYPKSNKNDTKLEFELINQLLSIGCKVPNAVAYYCELEESYLIYQFLEGESLAHVYKSLPIEVISVIVKDVFDNITQVSNFTLNYFGNVCKPGNKYSAWKDFLEDSIEYGLPYLMKNDQFETATVSRIKRFMKQQLKTINVKVPSLAWSDLSMNNMIILDNRLSGFIDFEGCIAGDPILPLGYLYLVDGESSFYSALHEYYQEKYEFSNAIVLFYSFLRLLRIAPFLTEPLPTGLKRKPVFTYFKGLQDSIRFI